MKRFRLFLFQLLVACLLQNLCLGANCVWGQNANAGFRFNYKVINEAKRWVELSKCTYSGSETEAKVVVPQRATLNGKTYAVHAIGTSAFKNIEELVSVTIQPGVKRLEAECFDLCGNLREVILPEGLTYIGDRVFLWADKMQELNIPSTVTHIGESAFSQCKALKSIVLPEGLTSVPEGAFYGCKSLHNVVLPQSVQHIGDECFNGCQQLTKLTLPKELRTIGKQAFLFCYNLQSLSLPSKVCSIAEGVFNACYQLRLSVDADNSHYVVRNNMLFSHELDTLFCCNENVGENVVLPENVQVIAPLAAQYNDGLRRITLSPTLIEIGESAFGNCANLENVSFPASLCIMGDNVFEDCFKLQQIMLPCTDVETATILYKAMNNPQRKFVVADDCEALRPLLTQHKNVVAASTILPRPKRRVADMIFKPFAAVDVNTPLWQLTYDALRGLAMMQRLSVNVERETLSNYEKAVFVLPGIDEFRINFSRCYTENDTLACLESSIACRSHEQEVASYIKRELTEKLDYNMKDLSNKRKGAAMFTKFGTQNTIFVIPDPDWERVFLLNVHTGTDCYERVISRFDK